MLVLVDVWTIEVADGPRLSARAWRRAHGELLVEAAVTNGAQEWTWVVRDWGVLLEITLRDEGDWLRFRGTPAVQAALDSAPDPVSGMWVYSGRGGSSAARIPRRPKPVRLSDGAPLPEPESEPSPWQQPLGRRHGQLRLAHTDSVVSQPRAPTTATATATANSGPWATPAARHEHRVVRSPRPSHDCAIAGCAAGPVVVAFGEAMC